MKVGMKETLLVLGLSLCLLAGASAAPSDVVYSEGEATVKYRGGGVEEVYIGDAYDTGDTVTTGFDGFVELNQAGLTLKINPDTVFTLQEKEQSGEATGVFSLVLGSIRFRYDRITGREPLIQTGSCVAAVRGTEFTVFAGADGSALVVVDSGRVEVEAEGRAVQLEAEEGVEVRPGQPPGEKFVVHRDQIDYRSWNEEKLGSMLEDPLLAMERIQDRLDYYIDNVNEYFALFREYDQRLADERDILAEIQGREGDEAAGKFRREVISPLAEKRANLYINLRFYSLAALSLRRYVGGRLYLFMKARYITDPADPLYRQYRERFRDFLDGFEDAIVPHLVDIDI